MKTNVFQTVRVGSITSQQPDRKEQFLELSAFLFLIVPSMALSFFAIKQGSLSFSLSAVATIFRDLSLVSLILFFLWRNRESLRTIGCRAMLIMSCRISATASTMCSPNSKQ